MSGDAIDAWRARADALDAADPLRAFRGEFHIPPHGDGEQRYFCGNSLGLQPKAVRQALLDELDDWATHGVEGHFNGRFPWMPYHAFLREGLATLVGAEPTEVVAMNSLSVNLHLMMVSFYRPTAQRHAILIEEGSFPSDRYAVESQVRLHGFDPATSLIELAPDADGTIPMDALERVLAERGQEIALVLWPGVQYRSGQAFDPKEVTRLGHAQGAIVGFDLAHAAGNLQLALHDSNADFAAWCSYKYLNAGPGAVAGCFVHARHAHSEDRPRLAGWWGHDQETRFRMDKRFVPTPGADGWQLSNPPILALAPVRVSLDQFTRATMPALRAKSVQLTGFLEAMLRERLADTLHVVTPADPARRGCQLSLRVAGGRTRGRALFEHLGAQGIIGDWREPDVIRISPTPMYNRFADLPAFVAAVEAWRDGGA